MNCARCLPSSPGSLLQGLLPTGLGRRSWGLVLNGCLEINLMGIRLRTSRPPKVPEQSLPWRSLSVDKSINNINHQFCFENHRVKHNIWISQISTLHALLLCFHEFNSFIFGSILFLQVEINKRVRLYEELQKCFRIKKFCPINQLRTAASRVGILK